MRFVLEIDCDQLPDDVYLRGSIAEILNGVADQIAVVRGPVSGALSCGYWRFIATPAPDPDGVSA